MKSLIAFITFFCFLQPTGDVKILQPPTPASTLKELDLKGPIKEVIEYSYSVTHDDEDTSKKRYTTITEFDRQGKLLNETAYSPDRKLISKSLYDYTKKDSVAISQFDDNNKLANKLILKYDDKGFLVEYDQYTPPSPAPFKTTFKYDGKGNKIEQTAYFAGGHLALTRTTTYNEKNQKIQTDLGSRLNSKIVYKYNELGCLVEEEVLKNTDSSVLAKQKYTRYDKYGNWLTKVFLEDPSRKKITEREFKYF